MTPEAQNIAIAESLRWTSRKVPSDETVKAQGYDEFRHTWWTNPQGFTKPLPNYHGSLDACAEFEATLADTDDDFGSRWQYIQELIEITGAECMEAHRNVFTVVNADAPQRCEAYLRAIWKWEESE